MNQLVQIIDLNIPALNDAESISKNPVVGQTGENQLTGFAELLGEKLAEGIPVQFNPELSANSSEQPVLNQEIAAEEINQYAGLYNLAVDNPASIGTRTSLVDNIEIQSNNIQENCGLEKSNPERISLSLQTSAGIRQNVPTNPNIQIKEAFLQVCISQISMINLLIIH